MVADVSALPCTLLKWSRCKKSDAGDSIRNQGSDQRVGYQTPAPPTWSWAGLCPNPTWTTSKHRKRNKVWVFSLTLAHLLSGFMSYSASSHQGANNMFWLCLSGAVVHSGGINKLLTYFKNNVLGLLVSRGGARRAQTCSCTVSNVTCYV